MNPPGRHRGPLRAMIVTALWALVAAVAGFVALFQDTPLLNQSVLASRVELDPARMTRGDGFAFRYPGLWFGLGDRVNRQTSSIALFEDARELAPRRAPHAEIERRGHGAWSHWTRWIIFSSSDGTDPRTNGRRYSVVGLTAPIRIGSILLAIAALWMTIRSFARLLVAPSVRTGSTATRVDPAAPRDAAGCGEALRSGAIGTRRSEADISAPPAMALSRGRRLLLGVATLLVTLGLLLLLLVALELGLRLTAVPPEHGTLRLAAPLGWERAGDPARIVPPGAPVTAGSFRVLLLGDSFSHERTWGEKTLSALRHRGVDAVGFEAGVSGYGTTQQLMVLERLLPEIRPDAVVLQFYGWNDMRDNWRFPAICYNPRMVHRPYMDENGAIEAPSEWSLRIRRLEVWKQLVEPLLDPLRVRHADSRIRNLGMDRIAQQRQRVIVDFYIEESWTPFYRPSQQDGAYVAGAWRITERALRAVRDRCAEHGIPVVLVALDAPFTVDARDGGPEPRVRFRARSDWDDDLPLRRLAAIATSLDLPFVDLTPALRARRERMNGAAQFDGNELGAHLLPEAEEVFAESLVPMLQTLLRDRQPRRR